MCGCYHGYCKRQFLNFAVLMSKRMVEAIYSTLLPPVPSSSSFPLVLLKLFNCLFGGSSGSLLRCLAQRKGEKNKIKKWHLMVEEVITT